MFPPLEVEIFQHVYLLSMAAKLCIASVVYLGQSVLPSDSGSEPGFGITVGSRNQASFLFFHRFRDFFSSTLFLAMMVLFAL